MKNIKIVLSIVLVIISSIAIAQESNKNIQEVARKGKSDLISVLSTSGKTFNFGVSANDVERSEIGNPIVISNWDFNSLLSNSVKKTKEELYVVPLTSEGKVITTITIAAAANGGFKVAELINHEYTEDLNKIADNIKRGNYRNLEVVIVPNLNAVLYVYEDLYYTNYNGKNIKEGFKLSEIQNQFFSEAKEFQLKYGDELKKNKLVR